VTAGSTSTVIRGVRVFDGEHRAGSVLLARRTIAAVGADLGVPAGARVIDGGGATLLPGLIDCHVHAGDVRALGQALAFGVTTELDMFSDPHLAARRRSLAARRDDVAGIRTATQGATAPGSQLGRLAPGLSTVAGPDDAAAFVAARAAQGADYLKVYLEDPAWYGSPPCPGPPSTRRSCPPRTPARSRPTRPGWPPTRAWAPTSTRPPGPSSPGPACWPAPAPRPARPGGSTTTPRWPASPRCTRPASRCWPGPTPTTPNQQNPATPS
jgi:hypothetical protein